MRRNPLNALDKSLLSAEDDLFRGSHSHSQGTARVIVPGRFLDYSLLHIFKLKLYNLHFHHVIADSGQKTEEAADG